VLNNYKFLELKNCFIFVNNDSPSELHFIVPFAALIDRSDNGIEESANLIQQKTAVSREIIVVALKMLRSTRYFHSNRIGG